MSELIRVPDLGGEGEVIELLVKVGDRIEADQSVLTLESDKASMEVPSPKAGVIKEIKVKIGDRLKEGDELLVLEVEGAAQAAPAPKAEAAPAAAPQVAAPAAAPAAAASGAGDDITDDEFEAILDQLHGKGSFIPDPVAAAPAPSQQNKPAEPAKAGDEIDDAEFEALLDQLHGKGKAPAAVPAATAAADGFQRRLTLPPPAKIA